MTLNFKLKSWEAETDFVTATITKTSGAEPFVWEIYSKIDREIITGGTVRTLDHAKNRCKDTAITVADAEGYRFASD